MILAMYRWTFERPHIRMWTDASGVDRWPVVVVLLGFSFYRTRWQCAQWLWDQLWHGSDNNIATQECMVVVVGRLKWHDEFEDSVVTAFADNEAVRCSCIKGSSNFPEVAIIVARFGQLAATCRWRILIRRVESKANIADGFARNHWDELRVLRAQWVRPVDASMDL